MKFHYNLYYFITFVVVVDSVLLFKLNFNHFVNFHCFIIMLKNSIFMNVNGHFLRKPKETHF